MANRLKRNTFILLFAGMLISYKAQEDGVDPDGEGDGDDNGEDEGDGELSGRELAGFFFVIFFISMAVFCCIYGFALSSSKIPISKRVDVWCF